MRLRLGLILAMVLTVVAGVLVATAPVEATRSSRYSGTYTRSFSATKQRFFATINRCVRVTVTGTTTFRLYTENSYVRTYATRKVIHPTLKVQTFPACIVGPQQYKPVYKMSLSQRWASSTCSAGLSIGVSAPWGVSVGATPSCSKAKLAKRSTSYTGRTGVRTQYNSTTTISFGNEYLAPVAFARAYGGPGYDGPAYHRYPLCFKVAVSAVIYPTRLSGSDSYLTGLKPCVRYW
jgi:hypothetical protein